MNKSVAVIAALMVASSFTAHAGKLYKWIDKDGNVSYQDSPPPPGMGRVEEKTVKTRGAPAEPGLESVIAQFPVTLYSSNKCAPCDMARLYLNKRKIPFTEKSVSNNLAVREELKQKTGGEDVQVPTITIGSRMISEYSQAWLDSELDQAGYPRAGGQQPAEGQPQQE